MGAGGWELGRFYLKYSTCGGTVELSIHFAKFTALQLHCSKFMDQGIYLVVGGRRSSRPN